MIVTKFYDPYCNRLVYIQRKADESYWDEHWNRLKERETIYRKKISPFNLIVRVTKKFLPPGSLILEGGAGLAQNSWYLYLAGYKTIALDFAPDTVNYLKKVRSEVNPVLGDVRSLPLKSESVDGY